MKAISKGASCHRNSLILPLKMLGVMLGAEVELKNSPDHVVVHWRVVHNPQHHATMENIGQYRSKKKTGNSASSCTLDCSGE